MRATLSFPLLAFFLLIVCPAEDASAVIAAAREEDVGGAFPHYMQCDPRWANDTIGVPGAKGRSTICMEGCALTSLASALAGFGVRLPGDSELPTPGTLNRWLLGHQGYVCDKGFCNNLRLSAPDDLSAGFVRLIGEWGGSCCGGDAAKPSLESMKEMLSNTDEVFMVYIAHVRQSSHFVLLTGWDAGKGEFSVLDPFYPTTSYSYEDISDVIMYSVLPPKSAMIPQPYRLFKQYDYRWANDTMTSTTVAKVGCLMSSTSMAINGHGILIPQWYTSAASAETQTSHDGGNVSNPGTLNAWLRKHHGYVGDNNLDEAAVPKVDPQHISWGDSGMHKANDISMDAIKGSLRAGQPVIANVLKGRHFVLVVGWDEVEETKLYVNDPGFWRISYDYGDVVGWRMYNMTQDF
eukprot:g2653.t1